MSSILQLQNFTSACTGGFTDACWVTCNQRFEFQQLDSSYAVFGPLYLQIKTSSGLTCDCTPYEVTNARVSYESTKSLYQALGASVNQNPYGMVSVAREEDPSQVVVTWIGGGVPPFATTDSCTADYLWVGGSEPFTYYEGSNWWGIVLACVFGLVLVCIVVSLCRVCRRRGRIGRPQGWHPSATGQPGAGSTIFVSEMSSNPDNRWDDYNSRPSRTNTSTHQKNNSGDYPVAVAVPVDEYGRQIAVV